MPIAKQADLLTALEPPSDEDYVTKIFENLGLIDSPRVTQFNPRQHPSRKTPPLNSRLLRRA
jgi:hypothetical protein